MDSYRHTKLVEVPQDRVWRCLHAGRWAYVWEDGYDALAYVEQAGASGMWHWWTTYGCKSGFERDFEAAKRATGYA